MDRSIVDTAITSRKCKRETYKKIILLIASYVVHMKLVHNWELGRRSFLNPLYRGTEKDCIEQLRLSKSAFFYHCRILQENETISRQFNDVLRTVMKVSKDYLNFQPYTLEGAKANKWRWFKRCIRALDGTHIPITVSPDKRPRYRKYFLVDAGYTNGLGFLASYRGTRYHLNEWIGNTTQSYKELFNLGHASARNAIESVLRTPSFFDIKTQIRIINACFVLHNFTRDEQQTDKFLEVQNLKLLSVVDEELVHQSRDEVQNNVIDDITTIQATKE
ncbi:hypothetical protein HKD37_20G055469 [Glycine soja]